MTSPARSSDNVKPTPRVLYLVTSDVSAGFLRGQLAYLRERGWEVDVATRQSASPAPFDDGVRVHDIAFEREPSPMRDLRSLVNVMRLMRRLRPDVVNASTPKAGLLGMVGAWICRVPRRVYVVRGLRFETASGWRRQVLRALERGTSSRATNVVYNSRSLLSTADASVRFAEAEVLYSAPALGTVSKRQDSLLDQRKPKRDACSGLTRRSRSSASSAD